MNEERKYGALSSSEDPKKLATSVSGAIIMFSSLIIWAGSYLGVPLTDTQIGAFATQLGLAVGSLTFIYGVIRKAVVFFAKKY